MLLVSVCFVKRRQQQRDDKIINATTDALQEQQERLQMAHTQVSTRFEWRQLYVAAAAADTQASLMSRLSALPAL